MVLIVIICILLSLPATITAQEMIQPAKVYGSRPMKKIGVHESEIDSLVLKENIALSVADVLTFNSPLFVKQYGRATLSTVSFRGTGPSHTQVMWNDMKIVNPMLGMTDFSMIPAYFIDDASLLHGTSSINETDGGLGGMVKLSSTRGTADGFDLKYVQGVGMYHTFDEFLRLQWGDDHWQISTRALHQSSRNDFPYRNHDKKINVYDDDKNIIDSYYPMEVNKNGAFADFHLLQEAYYDNKRGDRFGLNAWYINSSRELPLLTIDYSDDTEFENIQRENTFRGVFSWDHLKSNWKIGAKAGYIHTWMTYNYSRDPGNGILSVMTDSRSKINTFYGKMEGEYSIEKKWYFTTSVSLYQHFVQSVNKNIILKEGDKAIVGYDKGRVELSMAASAKWRPIERIGLSAVMRGEMSGNRWAPIPALFADYLISKRGNIVAKASVSRNYRFPTLNDLYFLPGGNPNLKNESGNQYEAGLSFSVGKEKVYSLSGSLSWYEQHVDNWILWLPTIKGFFSPVNIKKVHAYGIELESDFEVMLSKEISLALEGTFSWAPSINEGDPISPADKSVGKQLPYEPVYSANVTGTISWRNWRFLYLWSYYSERYTMSSNDITLTGRLTPYFMSNISLEKSFSFKWADISVKGTINNLFNEEYLSVLSRPMPRMNCEFFIGITPKWSKR